MRSRTVLYAEEGMILTDGETYGKQIFLAEGKSAEHYREIAEEEAQKLQEAHNMKEVI